MKRYHFKKSYRIIKRKKSIFQKRFFWFFILTFIGLSGLTYFLIFSSYFEVKEIKIYGNEKIKKEEIEFLTNQQIIHDFKFFRNKNIFLVNFKKINDILLEKFPLIANINFKKEFPQTLKVEIVEKKPIAVFKQNDNYFFIDKEGIIFEKISGHISNFILIQNYSLNGEEGPGKQVISKEDISKIFQIENYFKEELKIPVTDLTIVSEDRLNAKTQEGWQVYFNLSEDIKWQLVKLNALLEKRIPPEKRKNVEYIDLRFDRVYIFPENYNR